MNVDRVWLKKLQRNVVNWVGVSIVKARNDMEREKYGDFYLTNVCNRNHIVEIGANPWTIERLVLIQRSFEREFFKQLRERILKATGLTLIKSKGRAQINSHGRYYLIDNYGFTHQRQIDFDQLHSRFFRDANTGETSQG